MPARVMPRAPCDAEHVTHANCLYEVLFPLHGATARGGRVIGAADYLCCAGSNPLSSEVVPPVELLAAPVAEPSAPVTVVSRPVTGANSEPAGGVLVALVAV